MGLNPLKRVNSILTMGRFEHLFRIAPQCLNPLKRVNSILTSFNDDRKQISDKLSQSPQTGQFNSYSFIKSAYRLDIKSQSPQTGQFNSYLWSSSCFRKSYCCKRLNPLKRVNSILTYICPHTRQKGQGWSLNPLKRVNSILTQGFV